MSIGAPSPVRTGASLNRGRSKQDYGTPPDFLAAIVRRFGGLSWDLAATAQNTVVSNGRFFSEVHDALTEDWTRLRGNLFLNPPFADITPWAKKCAESTGPERRILLLTPAAIGSNWFAQHVHRKAFVLGLSPRLQFVGTEHGYPKDLSLSIFDAGINGFDVWRWK